MLCYIQIKYVTSAEGVTQSWSFSASFKVTGKSIYKYEKVIFMFIAYSSTIYPSNEEKIVAYKYRHDDEECYVPRIGVISSMGYVNFIL